MADNGIVAYVFWREACRAVWNAYGRWSAAPRADVALAFAAYQSALDRERRAADCYARATQGGADRLTTDAPTGASRS
jgi:hypothetical protein